MKCRKVEYPMGSMSSGTMREEDLIPEFVDSLETLAKSRLRAGTPVIYGTVPNKERREHLKECRRIRRAMRKKRYFGSEEAGYDLNETLFNLLSAYAAPYFYFGSHPGDGADYGFWLSEDFQCEFEGLKVNDLAEVPRDYAGEILQVSDHGNAALYVKSRTGEPKEIWSIV